MKEELKIKDKCVTCEKETQYDKESNINVRFFYVEGCGQLCPECYNKIYKDQK